LEFEKSLLLLEHINRKSLEICDKSDNERVKLQALSLSAQVKQTRSHIVADAYRVSQAVSQDERTVLQSQVERELDQKLQREMEGDAGDKRTNMETEGEAGTEGAASE